MAKSTPKHDYEVGYKRPPRSTQFQPGQSGNRKGRPTGALNLISILEKELRTRVNFTENGKVKSASQGAVMMKQLVRKAATGLLARIQYSSGVRIGRILRERSQS